MSKQSTVMIIVSKWIGSTKIQGMKPDEEGAYLRLLLIASQMDDCGLPDDDNELANLSRLGKDWFKKTKISSITRGERIRQCFNAQNGRLFNDRLTQDREQYNQIIEQKRKAGIVSGERRRNETPTAVQRLFNGCSTGDPTDVERETQREGNGEATVERRAKSEEQRALKEEASGLSVVPTRPPARHPGDAIAWVRESLEDYFSTLGAKGPPGKPDDELCCKIIDITGVGGLQAFQDTLRAKHHDNRKDVKKWGWFLSIAREAMLNSNTSQVDEWEGLNASNSIV